jgi:hypothetical protein
MAVGFCYGVALLAFSAALCATHCRHQCRAWLRAGAAYLEVQLCRHHDGAAPAWQVLRPQRVSVALVC